MIDQFSIAELDAEIEEKSRDLAAFAKARAIVRERVLEVVDSKSRLTPLPEWGGTDAVLGSLDLSIHAMERTIAELKAFRAEKLRQNPLRVVKEDGGAKEQ